MIISAAIKVLSLFGGHWHESCMFTGVKLVMDTTPAISDVEMHRRAQVGARFNRAERTHSKELFRRKVYNGLRRMAVFLLGAVIVAFVLAHRAEIARMTAQKIKMVASHVQKKDESSELRKNALTHEQEVNEVVGK